MCPRDSGLKRAVRRGHAPGEKGSPQSLCASLVLAVSGSTVHIQKLGEWWPEEEHRMALSQGVVRPSVVREPTEGSRGKRRRLNVQRLCRRAHAVTCQALKGGCSCAVVIGC